MSVDVKWVRIADRGELAATRRLVREVEGLSILLLQSSGDVIAIHNACTHLNKPLDGGRIIAGQIHCPFHGACFDLKTGEAVSGPAVMPLRRFAVRIDGDTIFINADFIQR